ncbi:TPA: hypothetical protein NJ084_000517 [Vibrio parahaemolyticus]|uniref:hypothetical protein n=3 Tax=Vibrio TaxID=662 RepID=UPI0003C7C644|nr:hypothetical protein [Vibrio parahaemolyticus]MDF4773027.1 hypothetical protein [Vibrio parahaemolyticus]MDG2651570.1 hypothetical protein [Vibrio parahaemolyticus]MEA5314112.1 hypothetical protein [Vibrio parahaemolyticus]MEA5368346.1 hypothetical protein [Vibrio parahaemolyticus]TMX40801.1 hypothetical protein DA098_02930 [Vibrio parahaemolyticus]
MIVDYRKEAAPEPSREQVATALRLFLDTFPIQSQVCMKSYWKAVKTIESVTFKGMQDRYVWEDGEVDLHIRFTDGTGWYCIVRSDGTLDWPYRKLPSHDEKVRKVKRRATDASINILAKVMQILFFVAFIAVLSTCVGSNGSNDQEYCVPRIEC